jgi:CubicO group peptidase (beta-lactamase class C family)
MKKAIFFLIGAVCAAFSAHSQTGVFVPQLAAFDNAMLSLMSAYNVPGAQLAITRNGKLVYNRGFGLARLATQDSVYPGSVFRIASISKTITAVACMKLFQQGLLNLDARVFGPSGILNDADYLNILDPRTKDITVRMLLRHTGGWNRNTSGDPMFNAYPIAQAMGVPSPPSPEVVIRYMIANRVLDFTPGTQSQYSNFGYCVLGRVIEKITGQPYEEYVRNQILIPLGMTRTGTGNNLVTNPLPGEVTYYDFPGAPFAYSVYNNTSLVPWPYGGFHLEFMDSHGGWVSSCEDLLKFVCAIDRFSSRPDILPAALVDTMVRPTPLSPNYAFGIAVNTNNNWWHMGSLPGTTSEIVRNGNQQLNWAILLNTRDQSGAINAAVDNLVWNVLPSITQWPSFDLFSVTGTAAEICAQENQTILFPNPARKHLYFSGPSNVRVLALTGKELMNAADVRSVDVSALPAGSYLAVFSDNRGAVIQRTRFSKEP